MKIHIIISEILSLLTIRKLKPKVKVIFGFNVVFSNFSVIIQRQNMEEDEMSDQNSDILSKCRLHLH